MNQESQEQYAQQRANVLGCEVFLMQGGHVVMNEPTILAIFEFLKLKVIAVFKPNKEKT